MEPSEPPLFFERPEDLRAWFERHHATEDVLWVGYHRKAVGRPSVTWEESRDEALCFGWIDGLRRSIDSRTYRIRFTPRRAGSEWSLVNIERFRELERDGRMTEAGRAAFAGADEEAARAAARRRQSAALPPEYRRELEDNREAWEFFRAQPAGYRRLAALWVLDAKQETTRRRRLEQLVADSARGVRVKPLRRG